MNIWTIYFIGHVPLLYTYLFGVIELIVLIIFTYYSFRLTAAIACTVWPPATLGGSGCSHCSAALIHVSLCREASHPGFGSSPKSINDIYAEQCIIMVTLFPDSDRTTSHLQIMYPVITILLGLYLSRPSHATMIFKIFLRIIVLKNVAHIINSWKNWNWKSCIKGLSGVQVITTFLQFQLWYARAWTPLKFNYHSVSMSSCYYISMQLKKNWLLIKQVTSSVDIERINVNLRHIDTWNFSPVASQNSFGRISAEVSALWDILTTLVMSLSM